MAHTYLLNQYKNDKSNFDTLKEEFENLQSTLEECNRLQITNELTEEVLKDIKNIRLTLYAIQF